MAATAVVAAMALVGASPARPAQAAAPAVTRLVPTATMPSPARSQPHQAAASSVPAYWLVASDGGIFTFGGAGFYGSTGHMVLNKPIVGMAGTPDSQGYWLVASDGGIFTFGDAPFYGSTGGIVLNQPVVGMAATPDGKGYWLVASDGGIFTFGDARFYGSMGDQHLNQPIVGMAATPDGKGYWLVASDGGIFAFGDAQFHGSTGSLSLVAPVVGMTPSPDGGGYLLVAADGGVFAFGDTSYHGSLGGQPLSRPIVGMAATPDGAGYWFTDDNGAVSAFGDAGYYGSAPQVLQKPVVGMAEATGNGSYGNDTWPSGSYGYDLSNYQCGDTLPSGHTIGIVQVAGASFGPVNPCLDAEADWAGAGLNLYAFLTYGTMATGPSSCEGDPACNYGFAAAQDAYAKALAAGVDTQVGWWLDIENPPSSLPQWSTNLSENAQLVAGAIAGLRSEGINTVGVYSSPDVWNEIVGDYQPAVPYWMAEWFTPPDGPETCADVPNQRARNELPTGPVTVVQFGVVDDPSTGTPFDNDYAC